MWIQILSYIYLFPPRLRLMNSEFFKDIQPRPQNPTYVSNHIVSTMLFPASKYELIHPYTDFKITQRKPENTNPEMGRMQKVPAVDIRHRRSKSNLSSYGTSSLGNLMKISDKDVFQNQQKKYDIISNSSKEKTQSIKMFPKFRNEIQQDYGNQMRQAFIMGKADQGIKNKKAIVIVDKPTQK